MSDIRAIEAFERDPEEALAGDTLISGETQSDTDQLANSRKFRMRRAVARFAVEEPERFLELVGYLPHTIQDIVLQYFLLGREQTQIAEVVGGSQTSVWQGLRLGIEAICAIIAFKQEGWQSIPKADEAYQAMITYRDKEEGELTLTEPAILGQFDVPLTEKELEILFAPMNADGPAH